MRRTPLSAEELESMKAMYVDNKLSNLTIADRFSISANTVATVARRQGWPMRGSWWRFGMERHRKQKSLGEVFCGMTKDATLVEPAELEQAKTMLRRRGHVVFNAEIDDGPSSRGFIKVNWKRFTVAEVIKMAAPHE